MLLGINESASRCQECQTILIDNYSVEKKLCIEDDHERLAKLLLSVNQTKNSLRPLTPLEVAKEIKVWMEEKSLNKIEVGKKFRLKDPSGMIMHFLKLLQLPKQIQHTVGWEAGSVAISTASRIADLAEPKEMKILANALVKDQINRDEVVSIVELRKKNPEKSIGSCINDILDFGKKRARIELSEEYSIIGSLYPENKDFLVNQAKKENKEPDEILKDLISKEIPSQHIIDLKIKTDGAILLVLDEHGSKIFDDLPDKLNFQKIDFFNYFVVRRSEK